MTASGKRDEFEAIVRRIAGLRLTPAEIARILAAADRYQATGRYRDAVRPCGTFAAYRRHLRRGEPVDDACLAASREQGALQRKAAAAARKAAAR